MATSTGQAAVGKCGAMFELCSGCSSFRGRQSAGEAVWHKEEMQMRSVRAALHILSVSLTFNLQNHLHPRTETKTFPHDLSRETRPQILTMVKYCFSFLSYIYWFTFWQVWLEWEGSEQALSMSRVVVAESSYTFHILLFQQFFLLEFWMRERYDGSYTIEVVIAWECEGKQ